MADLRFDWFGLYQTSNYISNSTKGKAAESKQFKQKVNHTVILSTYKVCECSLACV